MGSDQRSLHSAGGGRRPVKVWNASRTIRKALVVSTYEEFQRKGREKVGLTPSEPVRVVLEGDGTQVMHYMIYLYRWPIFIHIKNFCGFFLLHKILYPIIIHF